MCEGCCSAGIQHNYVHDEGLGNCPTQDGKIKGALRMISGLYHYVTEVGLLSKLLMLTCDNTCAQWKNNQCIW